MNWYPDSGGTGTHHVTPDSTNQNESSDMCGIDSIFMSNGFGLKVQAVGSALVQSPFDNNNTFTLKNILHVPSMSKNLISVSKFA